VGVLVVGLVVAAILSVVALDSRNKAKDALAGEQNALATAVANEQLALANERLANANEQQALSLALSASANNAVSDFDLDLAILLAISANEIENPPPQSQRTGRSRLYPRRANCSTKAARPCDAASARTSGGRYAGRSAGAGGRDQR
jgi:hypothetical protein